MTSAAAVERLRGALAQSYTIDRELGRGGMATVYLAQDCKHERLVALKVLHPELAASLGPDRFLQEIKVAARMLLYNVASCYSLVGKADKALSCLERAIDRGFGHREWMDTDPDFASIRDLPRFKAIRRGM